MKTIQQFKEEVDQLPSTDLLKHVEYYRKNGDLIFAIDETLDIGHYDAKTKLTCEYGMALAENQNYGEAYPILIKAIELMNNDPFESERGFNNQETTFYQHLLFWFGVTTYHAKRHKESKSTFQRLLNLDPTNYKYKNWLQALQLEPINKTHKLLGWIFFVIVIVEIFLSEKIPDSLSSVYYATLFVFALMYLAIEGMKRNIKNKVKTTK